MRKGTWQEFSIIINYCTLFKKISTSCFHLFDPKPILIVFGINVGKGLCNVKCLLT